MLATGQIFVKESEVLLQLAASSVKMKSPALFKIWVQKWHFSAFVIPWDVQFTTVRMNNY